MLWRFFQLHVMDSGSRACCRALPGRLSTPCNGFNTDTNDHVQGLVAWLSTPCNGFTIISNYSETFLLDLSTPCNGFYCSYGRRLADLPRYFQLHVMDSEPPRPGRPQHAQGVCLSTPCNGFLCRLGDIIGLLQALLLSTPCNGFGLIEITIPADGSSTLTFNSM